MPLDTDFLPIAWPFVGVSLAIPEAHLAFVAAVEEQFYQSSFVVPGNLDHFASHHLILGAAAAAAAAAVVGWVVAVVGWVAAVALVQVE